MTDPGLNQRLRQRSRRAGFMIGMSMALTIAVCVAGFSVIYSALDDSIGDFISRDVGAPVVPTESPTPRPSGSGGNDNPAQPTESDTQPTPTLPAVSTTNPTAQADQPDQFSPDYQTSSQFSIRLRSEPSRTAGDFTILTTLSPATPLQFTGTDEPATDPEDGDRWMLFQTEDGEEGWIREIDVNPYVP